MFTPHSVNNSCRVHTDEACRWLRLGGRQRLRKQKLRPSTSKACRSLDSSYVSNDSRYSLGPSAQVHRLRINARESRLQSHYNCPPKHCAADMHMQHVDARFPLWWEDRDVVKGAGVKTRKPLLSL